MVSEETTPLSSTSRVSQSCLKIRVGVMQGSGSESSGNTSFQLFIQFGVVLAAGDCNKGAVSRHTPQVSTSKSGFVQTEVRQRSEGDTPPSISA